MNSLQLQFLGMIFTGWVNRSQQDVIAYLQAENWVLREQLGEGRLPFTDAERFVRSIKSECLAQIIPLGERHLRVAVKEYTEHYHVERNHQGLENELIEDRRGAADMNGDVERHERLGGILNYYYRRAA